MSLFNTKTITYKRYTKGGYTGPGNSYVPGTSSSSTLTGTWQPASGDDLKPLPEGRRIGTIYKLYTATTLVIDDPEKQVDGDKIVSPLDGLEYTVSAQGNYTNNLIVHNKYLCTRVKEAG
jgi:hypothetical protein